MIYGFTVLQVLFFYCHYLGSNATLETQTMTQTMTQKLDTELDTNNDTDA